MTDSKGRRIPEELVRKVDPGRRGLLKIILGSAVVYAAPVIASFPMQESGGMLAQASYYMTPM